MPSTLQSCRPTERSFSHREASRQARSRHFMRFFNTSTACRANSPRDLAKGGESPVRSPLERRRVDETSRRPPIRQSSRSVLNGEDVSPSLIPRLKLSARRFRVGQGGQPRLRRRGPLARVLDQPGPLAKRAAIGCKARSDFPRKRPERRNGFSTTTRRRRAPGTK